MQVTIQELRSNSYTFATVLSGKTITNAKQLKAAFPQFKNFDLRRKNSWKWVLKSLERQMDQRCFVPAV